MVEVTVKWSRFPFLFTRCLLLQVCSASIAPSGQHVATGSYDETVRVWELGGKLLEVLNGHTDTVLSVTFSWDGSLVASGSSDHTARVWEWETELELAQFVDHEDWVNSVRFSPAGHMVCVCAQPHVLFCTNVDVNPLPTFATTLLFRFGSAPFPLKASYVGD